MGARRRRGVHELCSRNKLPSCQRHHCFNMRALCCGVVVARRRRHLHKLCGRLLFELTWSDLVLALPKWLVGHYGWVHDGRQLPPLSCRVRVQRGCHIVHKLREELLCGLQLVGLHALSTWDLQHEPRRGVLPALSLGHGT